MCVCVCVCVCVFVDCDDEFLLSEFSLALNPSGGMICLLTPRGQSRGVSPDDDLPIWLKAWPGAWLRVLYARYAEHSYY